MPIAVTITMAKSTYRVGESLDFEIRIENVSDDTIRIPENVGDSYLPQMYDSNGEQVIWAYEISFADFYDEHSTVELAPRCFYGKKCRGWGLPHSGEYTFSIHYISPKNFGDPLPYYWDGEVESNKAILVAKEASHKFGW